MKSNIVKMATGLLKLVYGNFGCSNLLDRSCIAPSWSLAGLLQLATTLSRAGDTKCVCPLSNLSGESIPTCTVHMFIAMASGAPTGSCSLWLGPMRKCQLVLVSISLRTTPQVLAGYLLWPRQIHIHRCDFYPFVFSSGWHVPLSHKKPLNEQTAVKFWSDPQKLA